jgi:WD40 repeat protein
VFVWRITPGNAKVYELPEKRFHVRTELSPRGEYMVTRTRQQGWLWRTGSAARLAEIGRGRYAFRPDDARLLVYGETASLWNTATAKRIAELAGAAKATRAHFGPRNRHLVTVGEDGAVLLWNASKGTQEHSFSSEPARDARFGPSGILAVHLRSGGLQLIDPDARRIVATVRSSAPVSRFALGKKLLVTIHGNGAGEAWSLTTGKRIYSLRLAKGLRSAVIDADDKYIATRSRGDTVAVWDAGTGRMLRSMPWAGDPQLLAGGTRVLIGADPDDEGDGPSLWNTGTGELIEDFGSHHSDGMSVLENVTVVPGGRWLIAGHERRLIDVNNGRRLMGVGAESRGTWFPDGSRFYLVGSTDPAITAIVELHFPREQRTPAAIHDILSARSPWEVVDGRLLPHRPRQP